MSPTSQCLNASPPSPSASRSHEELDAAAHVLQMRKLALPMTRLSIMRPATLTSIALVLEFFRRRRRRTRACSSAGDRVAFEIVRKGLALPRAARPAFRGAGDRVCRRVAVGHWSRPVAISSFIWRYVGFKRPLFRLASMKGSRSPSSTAWVLPVSTPVRKSLMRDWSST